MSELYYVLVILVKYTKLKRIQEVHMRLKRKRNYEVKINDKKHLVRNNHYCNSVCFDFLIKLFCLIS